MEGWIKLHRKSIDSSVFQSSNLWKVWCYCLMRANHKGRKVFFSSEEIELRAGQFITGRFQGAEDCNMSPSTFRNQIAKLKELRNLDTDSDNRKTLITIINWAEYQIESQREDSKPDIRRTTNGQQKDTDKNVIKKETINSVFKYWNEKQIITHRKLTDKIIRKISGSLNDYSEEEIKTAIDNYTHILFSEDFYWTHKWTLAEFLQRGLEKFLEYETAVANYKHKSIISDNGHKPKEETLELNA